MTTKFLLRNPHDCVDPNPLGNGDVGVVIHESLVHCDVHPTQWFLIRNIMLEGISLCDHMQIQEELQANM